MGKTFPGSGKEHQKLYYTSTPDPETWFVEGPGNVLDVFPPTSPDSFVPLVPKMKAALKVQRTLERQVIAAELKKATEEAQAEIERLNQLSQEAVPPPPAGPVSEPS